MSEPTIETLARRLDRVERENRHMKQAGVVALAVIAAVVLMGQATPSKVAKVIEAEKFVVRDKSGKVRAELNRVWSSTTGMTSPASASAYRLTAHRIWSCSAGLGRSPGSSSGADRGAHRRINFLATKGEREMASDATVQNAVELLSNQLHLITNVLERIAAALERQAPTRML